MVAQQTDFDRASEAAPEFAVAGWRTGLPGQAEWALLASAAEEPNPFFERWFLGPSLQAFDPAGEVYVAQLRIDGKLVGLAPIARSSRYYDRTLPHLEIWLHANAFNGVPLIMPGFEQVFWDCLLRWADDHAGSAVFLHLPALPGECAAQAAVDDVARKARRKSAIVASEPRALLSSKLGPEDYFENALSTKKRKELRRQARRLGEQGVLEVVRVHSPGETEQWARGFLALEAAGWKGQEGSALASDAKRAEFFVETLCGAATAERFEGLSLTLDDKPIAMLATFLTSPGAFSFKTTFDEDFARFSPGVLLQKENLDLLARDGIDWCDSCAATDHPMIDHFWREQRVIVSRNIAIGGIARRAVGSILIAHESRRFARSDD